jgi:copper chaperone CopZ
MVKVFIFLQVVFLFKIASAEQIVSREIKGMHCSACAQKIQKDVCAQKQFLTCKVTLGEINYELKKGTALSNEELAALIKKSGKYELVPLSSDELSSAQ